jgi:hypothetical protein
VRLSPDVPLRDCRGGAAPFAILSVWSRAVALGLNVSRLIVELAATVFGAKPALRSVLPLQPLCRGVEFAEAHGYQLAELFAPVSFQPLADR